MTTTLSPGSVPIAAARPSTWGRRAAALSGPAFVVLVLTGNSLTETAAIRGADAAAAASATLAAKAGDPVVAVGTALELLGLMLLAVFTAHVCDLLRRRNALGPAAVLALLGAALMLAVKLGSAAPYLAGIARHELLSPEVALALVEMNGAAFVLGWLPWAVFVGSAAVSLHRAGAVGRLGRDVGVALGLAGMLAGLVGIVAADYANPLPFLGGLVWVLVVGVRLAVGEWGTIEGR